MFDIRTLQRPDSLASALTLLHDNLEAGVLAGGSDILVKLRDGKLGGRDWVSIQGVDELRTIVVEDDGTLRIGPLNTFAHIAKDATVRKLVPSLPEALLSIGGPQVRNIGTLGGNLCNGVPSADSASTCFAWDAEIEITSADAVRVLPIAQFYISAGKVDLQPGELVTGVLFRRPAYAGYSGAFQKYAMRHAMDIATVNCSVSLKLSADKQTFDDARIAYGVAAPTPIRTPHGEEALRGRPVSRETVDAAARAALADTRARDSWRASKAFRLQMLHEMTRRCLTSAVKRAGGQIGESR